MWEKGESVLSFSYEYSQQWYEKKKNTFYNIIIISSSSSVGDRRHNADNALRFPNRKHRPVRTCEKRKNSSVSWLLFVEAVEREEEEEHKNTFY